MVNWQPLILTFQLAALTTLLLLFIGTPIAYWLAHSRSRIKPVLEALISMPLVLPPTVLGFYLLIAFSPSGAFGQWLDEQLGLQLVFSFPGIVLGSMIYSLPFMVYPIQAGFARLSPSLREAAYVLGKSRRTTFFKILLPNVKASLLSAIVLTFAHTIGEFGVVLMIGGNIPGQTKVASIAIYDEVESLQYGAAHTYSLVLFAITFAILLIVYWVNGQHVKSWER